MATPKKLILTQGLTTLKFTSLDQAAAYMEHFNKAASKASARRNLLDALAGCGSGGNHKGGSETYNRNTAYGYIVQKA